VRPILLLGEGDLADEVEAALGALGADVARPEGLEPEALEAAPGPFERGVVVFADDAQALRAALLARELHEDLELLVTWTDEETAPQLTERIGGCRTTSMAAIVAPVLAGPCLEDDLEAVEVRDGTVVGLRTDGRVVEEGPVALPPSRRLRSALVSVLRPHDRSAALLLYGALGILAVLVVETFAVVAVLDQGLVDAFYGATKALVTVGPNDAVAKGPGWFKVVISLLLLTALVFEAFFTAGIVNRLIDRQLTGLWGRRAVPRRDHVVVVGLGRVGMRLCELLRDCGVAVVAVDDREDGEHVGVARRAGLPVVVGRGGDPSLLQRLGLRRALAVVAATDDDLENLGIAMAARSVEPDARVVLRVGDGRLANETRSLFAIGVVRDVHRIAAGLIAAQATGSPASGVLCHEDRAVLRHPDGRVEPAPIAASA
jgi:voltage-gated potassium channel Kch